MKCRLIALVCSNDLLAISLIAELRRNGWGVPERCSVVQPIAELAHIVIDQLLARIAGAPPVSHCLPCHIRPGESTQPYQEMLHAQPQ